MTNSRIRFLLLIFAAMLTMNALSGQADIGKLSENKVLLSYLERQGLNLSSYQWDDGRLNEYIRQIKRKKTSSDIFKGIGFGILSMGVLVISEAAKPQGDLLFDKHNIVFLGLGIAGGSLPFFAIGGNKKVKLKADLAKAKERHRQLQSL
ncbi:MAG: hypothetical protein J5I98_22150 [Phaeodactylibacter sp.]|nr:hypothetical protein [Phaeodactylibacter sp.]